MTTLEEMAVDVFSNRRLFNCPNPGIEVWEDYGFTKGERLVGTFSDYEMAQLNDLAIEIWSRRICTDDFYEFVNDGPWRLEDE